MLWFNFKPWFEQNQCFCVQTFFYTKSCFTRKLCYPQTQCFTQKPFSCWACARAVCSLQDSSFHGGRRNTPKFVKYYITTCQKHVRMDVCHLFGQNLWKTMLDQHQPRIFEWRLSVTFELWGLSVSHAKRTMQYCGCNAVIHCGYALLEVRSGYIWYTCRARYITYSLTMYPILWYRKCRTHDISMVFHDFPLFLISQASSSFPRPVKVWRLCEWTGTPWWMHGRCQVAWAKLETQKIEVVKSLDWGLENGKLMEIEYMIYILYTYTLGFNGIYIYKQM